MSLGGAMRKPLIVGNWKMHTSRSEAEQLTGAAVMAATHHEAKVEVGIAPPAVWLTACVGGSGHLLRVYGQNAHQERSGAFTGELSACMLHDAGADGVILGHSERRHVFGETDAVIAEKVVAALEADLHVILCVGETLELRLGGVPQISPPPLAAPAPRILPPARPAPVEPEAAHRALAQLRTYMRSFSGARHAPEETRDAILRHLAKLAGTPEPAR